MSTERIPLESSCQGLSIEGSSVPVDPPDPEIIVLKLSQIQPQIQPHCFLFFFLPLPMSCAGTADDRARNCVS